VSAQEPLWIDSDEPTGPPEGEDRSNGIAALTAPQSEGIPRLLLKPEEAAIALGVSRSTLYELLAAGAVESVHIGKSRRVPLAALERYVERLRAEQNPCYRKGL
jgi:excisionase family DNA binding protein